MMVGLLRKWLKSLKTKLEVARIARLCGVSAAALHEDLAKISGEYRRFCSVRPGGLNNQGMFLHLCNSTGKPLALSKVQALDLAQREAVFMRWQEEHELNLSSRCISLVAIEGSEYSILCSEWLKQPDSYDAKRVHQLHRSFSTASKKLETLGSENDLTDLVKPNTPIKKILRELVAQPGHADINEWCDSYLSERKEFFGHLTPTIKKMFRVVAERWQSISSPVALVHGDFKRQNILKDDSGCYLAIDLQYYLPGQPCWDLAFYYSKYDSGFIKARQDFLEHTDSSLTQQVQFVFFYIVASTINIKRRRRDWIFTTKVIPAMQEMEHLLGDREFEK